MTTGEKSRKGAGAAKCAVDEMMSLVECGRIRQLLEWGLIPSDVIAHIIKAIREYGED